MEHFIARQPIFDRNLKVFGYELLFRTGLENFFDYGDQDEASSRVIADSSLLFGIEEMTGGAKAFLNISRGVLDKDFVTLLPPSLVVVELLENVAPDPQVVENCRRLKSLGFILALDDFVYRPEYDPLLEMADIVKVDFLASGPEERRRLAEALIPRGIRLLAEKVETRQDYDEGLAMGYAYFQGYFFSRPVIVSRKDIPIFKLQYLRILKEVNAPEINFPRLAETIQGEVAISYKLLKYTNSVAFGLRKQVTSILQALALLGEREFKKWVSLLALAGMASDKPQELIRYSLVRAKTCELMAPLLRMPSRRGDLFLLGLFSLLDAIMDRPLEDILSGIYVQEDVGAALLAREGRLGQLLDLVSALEKGEWEQLSALASRLGLHEGDLPGPYIQAVLWARETYDLD